MLIEKCFVINLRIRPDRLKEFQERWPNNPLIPRPEVVNAIHGDVCRHPDNWTAGNGAWGCYRTHLNILEHCLNENVSSYAVFEDDAHFATYFSSYLANIAEYLPDDWQQLYLGGQLLHEHIYPPIKINDHIYQPYNVNRTHAFCVSRKGMLPMYRWISNLPFHSGEHIDHHLGRLHETHEYKVYCPGQWLVGQGGSTSNISGKTEEVSFWENPENFALSHWLYDKPICVVLRSSVDIAKKLDEKFHYGNWRDNSGYDHGLTQASKYRYPGPEITKWYNAIRSEIVKEKSNKIPCLFHPMITDEMISQANLGKVIYIDNPKNEIEVNDKLVEKVQLHNVYVA